MAFKCVFHRRREWVGDRGREIAVEIGDTEGKHTHKYTYTCQAKSSEHLNYVSGVLRVLADFVIRFSLELGHNYGGAVGLVFAQHSAVEFITPSCQSQSQSQSPGGRPGVVLANLLQVT